MDDMELLLRTAGLFAGGTASLALDVSKAVLPVSAAQMARMAHELGTSANTAAISNEALLQAAKELAQADDTKRSDAVSGLIHACVTFARDAVDAGHDHDCFMHGALDLALAGRCFLRVATLGGTEVPATSQPTERLQEQPAGVRHVAWWSRWTRKTRATDLEEHLLPKPSASSSSGQNKVQEQLPEKWLLMQTSALSMSLCLLPYMGRDGLLKNKDTFSSDYLWWVNLLFKLWWGLVALGVPCSLSDHWWIERLYARLSAHLGILGLTVLVGMFSHWMLATEATIVLKIFLALPTLFFIVSIIRCCANGDSDAAAIEKQE